mmetsp:Transcript_46864/g.110326  ORF Transcript_46864/g.110326 Transcript_46864/m.110326 type:complete len:211 (+) Transcript_46864:1-633(+)
MMRCTTQTWLSLAGCCLSLKTQGLLTSPPLLFPKLNPVQAGDTIDDLEGVSLTPCLVQGSDRRQGESGRMKYKRYLVVSQADGWFALVEPDTQRINIAIIRQAIPLLRIEEVRVFSRDAKALQVVVSAPVAKMRWGVGGVRLGLGPTGAAFPSSNGTTDATIHLTFEDEKLTLESRNRLVEARDQLLSERKATLADGLDAVESVLARKSM